MRPEARLGVGVTAMLALTAASFAVHLADEPSSALPVGATDGRTVFTARGCSGCHVVDRSGGSRIGPDLTNLATRAARRVPGLSAGAYVRQSVLEPQAHRVPGFEGVQMPTIPLTDTELDAVVSYLIED
jgi:mono/diheme cytochrome c family protein